MERLYYYFAVINFIGLVLMAWDKMKARTGAWRIPENNLLFIALAGGSAGVYLGLRLFHHKTRHVKFAVVVPVIFLIQVCLIAWMIYSNLL